MTAKKSKTPELQTNHDRLSVLRKTLVPNWTDLQPSQVAAAKEDIEACRTLRGLLHRRFTQTLTAEQRAMRETLWDIDSLIELQPDYLEAMADHYDMAGFYAEPERRKKMMDRAHNLIVPPVAEPAAEGG